MSFAPICPPMPDYVAANYSDSEQLGEHVAAARKYLMVKCEYCQSTHQFKEDGCPNCGAPVSGN